MSTEPSTDGNPPLDAHTIEACARACEDAIRLVSLGDSPATWLRNVAARIRALASAPGMAAPPSPGAAPVERLRDDRKLWERVEMTCELARYGDVNAADAADRILDTVEAHLAAIRAHLGAAR